MLRLLTTHLHHNFSSRKFTTHLGLKYDRCVFATGAHVLYLRCSWCTRRLIYDPFTSNVSSVCDCVVHLKLCLADAIHSFKFKQRESIAVKGNAGRRTRLRQYNSLLPNWLRAKNVIVLHVTWDYDVTLELHLQTIFPAASLETARPQ